MFLAIDIGNTTILFGLYDGERLILHHRIPTRRRIGKKTLLPFLKKGIMECMVSSVVPPIEPVLKDAIKGFLGIEPSFFDPASCGMPILCKGVGSDRILNAIGGFHTYGGPLIVVDFGTTTTFDVVSSKGEYLGGLICPGVEVSARAMWKKAYHLYEVKITKPTTIISKDTTTAMQAGIFFGTVAQVEGIIKGITKELGSAPKVVATGGLATLFGPDLSMVDDVDPFLVLKGLRIVSKRVVKSL